jgi:hypothetical protein
MRYSLVILGQWAIRHDDFFMQEVTYGEPSAAIRARVVESLGWYVALASSSYPSEGEWGVFGEYEGGDVGDEEQQHLRQHRDGLCFTWLL